MIKLTLIGLYKILAILVGDKTITSLTNELNEAKKTNAMLENSVLEVSKSMKDLLHKIDSMYTLPVVKESKTLESVFKIWLRDMIADFKSNPDRSKLVGDWGVFDKTGSTVCTYLFSDGKRRWEMRGNTLLENATTVEMFDGEKSTIVSIDDNVYKELIALLIPLAYKIEEFDENEIESDIDYEPNAVSKSVSIYAAIDKALDAHDFNKVKSLQEELEKLQKQK